MRFSMTGQDRGDLLIQVTAWAGLTVHTCRKSTGNMHNFQYRCLNMKIKYSLR
jgi:hypothetical protein